MSSFDTALRRLAALVEEVAGFRIPVGHLPFLATSAAARARAQGLADVETYIAALDQGRLAGEWRALLPLITVKESFFYRTPEHFAALSRVVIPDLSRRRSQSRRIRVWSAGCARGEEPWSVAMVLAEAAELAGWDWSVLATDVDEEALAAAHMGCYGQRAVRLLPDELRAAFLDQAPGGYRVSATLRHRVRFLRQNLVRDLPPAAGNPFDLIFLRNVLIYFAPDVQRRVVAHVEQALAPDGYLFVGPSETLWPVTRTLQPLDLSDCFCYLRAPARAGATPSHIPHQEPARDPQLKARTAVVPAADTQAVSAPNQVPAASRTAASMPQSLPEPVRSPECLAKRLAAGDLETAAAELAGARDRDPGNPEFHALEGLLHDLTDAPAQAQACYRSALYLDPRLFQIRLLLAQTLRRDGRKERAMAEFRQVLALLASGRARDLQALNVLEQPDAEAAQRICQEALRMLS